MRPTTRSLFVASLLVLPAAGLAHDDEDEDDVRQRPTTQPLPPPPGSAAATYQAECGSCHLAFPPRLLPEGSWRAMLQALDQHFGVNAEVDAATRQQLEGYLRANAGRPRPGPTRLRITEQSWWVHEHDEVSTATFARPAVLRASNCAACHLDADQGTFRERWVKIPR